MKRKATVLCFRNLTLLGCRIVNPHPFLLDVATPLREEGQSGASSGSEPRFVNRPRGGGVLRSILIREARASGTGSA